MINSNEKKLNYVVIIPILNPRIEFLSFVNGLIEYGFNKIIIVNDGSNSDSSFVFDELSKVEQCEILQHVVNMGKGRALKDGLNHYIVKYSDKYDGAITVDGDGQYILEDVIKVNNKSSKFPESLIVGKRNFFSKNVPFRSYFGNIITSNIFKFFVGGKLKDTQAGLRAIPNSIIYELLKLSGERYEFETNALIYSIQNKIDIKQVGIHTIYLDENKSSYFKPILDSVIIYSLIFARFLKFAITSMVSFVVDYIIYCFLCLTLSINNHNLRIYVAAFSARIVSSLVNYYLTKTIAFNNKTRDVKSLFKYYLLCFLQLLASANLVILIVNYTSSSEYSAKILVDLVLFFLSYLLQKKLIFSHD